MGGGLICASGTCASDCYVNQTIYSATTLNPMNSCQMCEPASTTSGWTNLVDGTSCGAGQVCSAVSCLAGCYIGGAYYPSGTTNPGNNCQTCQPGVTTTDWTNADGPNPGCAAGSVCSGGGCQAGCYVSGSFYSPSAVDSANACLSCQPAVTTSAWSNADGVNASCYSGEVCTGGACEAGCYINGTYYATNALEPGNPCQSCQPGTSTSAWSNIPDATNCGNGQVCMSGQCGSGCGIYSQTYQPGAVNPANPCQICQPAESTVAWSSGPDGVSCAPSEVCSQGSCASACFINGTIWAAGAQDPNNPCQSCQPYSNTTGWSNDADGTSCGAANVCSGGSCIVGCFIDSSVFTSGTTNPGDTCQTCQPYSNTTNWGNVQDGTLCGPDSLCISGTCSVAQLCTVAVGVSLNETSPYGDPITLNYTMVGGGGGAGGGSGYWAAGGGGGSSALLTGYTVINVASGGNGGVDSGSVVPGGNGTTVTGTYTLAPGANLTAYVGGGGGGGGWDYGGGGGSGYFGGAGGEELGYETAGGAGGGSSGGVGINGAGSGSSFAGGTGGGIATPGGTGATGGPGGPQWDTGGGGGGFGGGGGACTNDDQTLPSAGGSSGGTAANVTPVNSFTNNGTSLGGLGSTTWAGATSLPAAAGAGGASEAGQGGNAGFIILTYLTPTGTCSL
jgi:hypothetical protein